MPEVKTNYLPYIIGVIVIIIIIVVVIILTQNNSSSITTTPIFLPTTTQRIIKSEKIITKQPQTSKSPVIITTRPPMVTTRPPMVTTPMLTTRPPMVTTPMLTTRPPMVTTPMLTTIPPMVTTPMLTTIPPMVTTPMLTTRPPTILPTIAPTILPTIPPTIPPIKEEYILRDPNGIKNGNFGNIPMIDFGLNDNLSSWIITIRFTAINEANKWQGILGNMYNSSIPTHKDGWGIWLSPAGFIHFRISDNWATDLQDLGRIENNKLYELRIIWKDNSYVFELFDPVSLDLKQVNIGGVSKLTSNKGNICVGGWWGAPNEKFNGTIDLIMFYTPASPKIYYGPNPKIWNDSDCAYIKHGTPKLEKCKIECNDTSGCTAINYNPNSGDCTLRKCADGKEPSWDYPPYQGYSIYKPIKIPKFIIRYGGTDWRNRIEQGDETNANIQWWNPDGQAYNTWEAPNNEIALQFRYFAEYWLNKTGLNKGSTNVYTWGEPLTNHGVYEFEKNGSQYTGTYNNKKWNW